MHRGASLSPRRGAGVLPPVGSSLRPRRSRHVLGPLRQHASMTLGRRLPGTRQSLPLAAFLLSGSWGLSRGGGRDARPISSCQHLTPQHFDWWRWLWAGAVAVT